MILALLLSLAYLTGLFSYSLDGAWNTTLFSLLNIIVLLVFIFSFCVVIYGFFAGIPMGNL